MRKWWNFRYSPELSDNVVQIADLSQPLLLDQTYDWVISLEVGEHIPKQYERTFIENINRYAVHGVVLSWAVENQGGFGHFNCRNNDYIKNIFLKNGYTNDEEAEKSLRKHTTLPWFKNTIMVFRKAC